MHMYTHYIKHFACVYIKMKIKFGIIHPISITNYIYHVYTEGKNNVASKPYH